MLPTPLKVYKSVDPKSNVRSGAMFTFVLGTDPECTLLLEAVEFKSRLRWEYAFGRATRGGLIGRYKGNEVWRAEKSLPNEYDALAYTLTSPEADVTDVK